MTQTTTSEGDTVDFVIRWERGTSTASSTRSRSSTRPRAVRVRCRIGTASSSSTSAAASRSATTRARTTRTSPVTPYGLGQGYAIAWSTGTKTNTHYNLVLGGETALMVKSRFVTEYDDPEYTVGLGGSGGAIQQYVYGQNHPGLLDGAIPQYSYPDMVTQTIHVGDCELLERWMDRKALAQRPGVEVANLDEPLAGSRGSPASNTDRRTNRSTTPLDAMAGNARLDRVLKGWRGLSPLALNPHFGTAPGITPEQQARVEWTHWNDVVNVYGRDPGDRLRPLDVGQRRRPVRAAGAARRPHHARRVPRSQRRGRRPGSRRRTTFRRVVRSSRSACSLPIWTCGARAI